MFRFFRSKNTSKSNSNDAYYAFTKEFDREVHADELEQILGTDDVEDWLSQTERFETTANKWRGAANLAAIDILSDLKAAHDLSPLSDTVACLLIDHSGSMRGQRAILTCAAVQVIADCWDRLGVRSEILGFTTSSWLGGKSRQSWIEALEPGKPGRLCDLLHIIYKDADDTTPGAPWQALNLLRDGLLKENVDGEALLWAADRLKSLPEKRKVVVVVSDGAPVDDSTLMENHPDFLVDHLKSVISDLEEDPQFQLAAIGIDHRVSEYYSRSMQLDTTQELTGELPRFSAEILLDLQEPHQSSFTK